MAVVFDHAAQSSDAGVTTITATSIPIAAVANRAAFVCVYNQGNPGAITTPPTLGGVAGTAISGASGNAGGYYFACYKIINPPSGSQTLTCTWTTSRWSSLVYVIANGVDQTTGINNGGFASSATTNATLNITSNSGDLTVTAASNANEASTMTTNRTKRVTYICCADTGPGTAGTIGHTWTQTGAAGVYIAGANFISAEAAIGLMGQACL